MRTGHNAGVTSSTTKLTLLTTARTTQISSDIPSSKSIFLLILLARTFDPHSGIIYPFSSLAFFLILPIFSKTILCPLHLFFVLITFQWFSFLSFIGHYRERTCILSHKLNDFVVHTILPTSPNLLGNSLDFWLLLNIAGDA